ncbi:MAG: hypothetical protein FWB72_02655 [Firmicutes bacterium]|nr:hypothetical protein [Bacillota bacterium]
MKKLKLILIAMLTFTFVFTLAACNGNGSGNNDNDNNTTNPTTEAVSIFYRNMVLGVGVQHFYVEFWALRENQILWSRRARSDNGMFATTTGMALGATWERVGENLVITRSDNRSTTYEYQKTVTVTTFNNVWNYVVGIATEKHPYTQWRLN